MTEQKPWLSLPDEEPPERGLAELMAAARMKAEVMTNPPWWRRLFDLLRRPPVLALATILVLLGGVIVVGRHRDEVPAPAVTAEPPVSATPPAQVVAPPPPVVPAAPPIVTPKHIAKNPPVAKPEPRRIEQTKTETKAMDRAELQLADPRTAPDAAGEDDDEAPVQNGVVTGAVQKATAAPDPLAPCHAAAARKDCAGVKACVQKLPAPSRANATNDAALKSCL